MMTGLAIGLDHQHRAGFELGNVAVDRFRRRHIGGAQIGGQSVAVDLGLAGRMGAQRAQFGTEQKGLAEAAPIERLDAQPVPHQGQAARLAVPQAEGEKADQAPYRLLETPHLAAAQEYFGIGMTRVAARRRRQFGAQILPIEDLAIIGQHIAAGAGLHRLVAGRRQVDDGQAPMPQREAGLAIGPDAAVVGAAMGQGVDHAAGEKLGLHRPGAGGAIEEPGNPAHLFKSRQRPINIEMHRHDPLLAEALFRPLARREPHLVPQILVVGQFLHRFA